MSTAPDLDAARRSHVLEYLGQHPDGASAREIHAAAVESGEAEILGWDPRWPGAGPLVVLHRLRDAREVALLALPIGKYPDPVENVLDQRYVIAQMALL